MSKAFRVLLAAVTIGLMSIVLYEASRQVLNAPETELTATAAPRSSQWPKVRADHLKEHPFCAACGGKTHLQVHHIEPFHLNPDKELDPTNLITLCEAPNRLCHLRLGHAWNFKTYNPNVKKDAARDAEMIKNRKDNEP